MMRTVIVDDEAPARDRLRRLLAEVPGVDVVGEARDGVQGMEEIVRLTPDVVFLDIQMPGCTGLEVAASLPSPRPHIVFCTAFDQYAVDAFELNAVDYLLKPVNRARLERTIERVKAGQQSRESIKKTARAAGPPSRFLARRGSMFYVVQGRDVLCFLSEAGMTRLIAVDQRYWMSLTLNDLQSRVDERRFFRISRAVMVNLDAVREVAPAPGGSGEITLRDGSRHAVSRRRFKALTEKLGA